jgi:hypothetical protein
MQKFKEYIEEKYNRKLIETDYGFVTYKVFPDKSVFIYSMFISKEHRNQGKGRMLFNMVVKKENAVAVSCDVDKTSNSWSLSLSTLIKMTGCEIYKETKDKVFLLKEL